MAILCGQPVQRAAPADGATAEAAPAVEAPADAALAVPVTSPPTAAVAPSPSIDKIDAELQRPDAPWRLLLA